MSTTGTFIGVDLGGTNVRAALVRGSDVEAVKSAPIDASASVDDVMSRMCALLDSIWNNDVEGIGVGVPSVVDVDEGIVYDVQNIPSMKEVPVGSLLHERYSRPVFVNNDVNCFVMGEYAFGKARGFRHVAGLNFGTGFAAGLIINGRLYEGPNCGAGEFGMVPYKDSILEDYCSGLFFVGRGLNAADVARDAAAGDPSSILLWEDFGSHVGQAIKTVLYSIDPEIVILGGSIRKAYDLFKKSMWEVVETFAYRKTLERLKFELSDLDHAPLLGAASLPRAHFLRP